jgi:hypothetical protein
MTWGATTLVLAPGPSPAPDGGSVWNLLPPWLRTGLIGAILVTFLGLLVPAAWAGKRVSEASPLFRPVVWLVRRVGWLPGPEVQEHIRLRQPLADYLLPALRAANLHDAEPWVDDRYTPLDVEVEVDHRPRWRRWHRSAGQQADTVRQPLRDVFESLARAGGQPQLLLLEGEPGAGKSVALRHLAIQLCEQASTGRHRFRDRRRDPRWVPPLPVYVNLAQLRPTDGTPVTWQTVQQLVRATVEANDPGVRELLEAEFQPFDHRREWLFLFDSFDEIPELLSAVEADRTIERYEAAITEFLRHMTCSGVIASRPYRGPRHIRDIARLVALSEHGKHELAAKRKLTPDEHTLLFDGLRTANDEVWKLSSVPLFLTLLCEHVKRERRFPSGVHDTFESWTVDRFRRERVRLFARFGLTPEYARELAEAVAFCMLREDRLGFVASRRRLASACARRGLATETQVHEVLEALDFVGLSKGPPASTLAGRPGTAEGSFEFAHRRVHEYLAASFVRREPRRVPRAQLLTDGRWREAAVACLQLGDDRQLAGLLDAAAELLDRALAQVPDLVDDDDVDNTSPLQLSPDPVPFAWPVRVLHVLALLDAGLANRSSTIAEPLRRRAGRLLLTATRDGTTADRKTALGAVGSASQAVRERLLRAAFADDSAELRDAAYRQVGRLRQVPDDIAGHIRRMLLTLWGQGWAPRGELGRQQLTIRAQLLRLPEPEAFLVLRP